MSDNEIRKNKQHAYRTLIALIAQSPKLQRLLKVKGDLIQGFGYDRMMFQTY